MKLFLKTSKSLFLMVFILIPVILGTIYYNKNYLNDDSQNKTTDLPINLTQAGITNISIQNEIPKLVWSQVQLKMTVASNRSGTLNIILVNPGSVLFFENKTIEKLILGEGNTQIFDIRINPLFFTLPGKYNLELIVTLKETFEQYSETFEIILGLGHTFIFSVLIIFGTACIVVLTKKYDIDKEKIITAQASQHLGKIPEGKMPCPTCHSIIDEGLAFCPECGDRIPEFLRFAPGSSS